MNKIKEVPEILPFGFTSEDFASFLNYPSLDKLFPGNDSRALEEIRANYAKTLQDLERIVRQGSKEDARKADESIKAINITLEFLSSLEELKRASGDS